MNVLKLVICIPHNAQLLTNSTTADFGVISGLQNQVKEKWMFFACLKYRKLLDVQIACNWGTHRPILFYYMCALMLALTVKCILKSQSGFRVAWLAVQFQKTKTWSNMKCDFYLLLIKSPNLESCGRNALAGFHPCWLWEQIELKK